MGLGKVIAAIFGILLLIIVVIGIDVYLTYDSLSGLSNEELSDLVTNPTFVVSGDNNEIVTVTIDVSLPSAGFIPKGMIIKLIVDFDGEIQSAEDTVDMGKSKTLTLIFTMTDTNAQEITNNGLTVSSSAVTTPTIFGQAINAAEQTIDLGSQTITV